MIDLFGNSVQFLGMPLSSAALFLLAGMLLGHLLWYRDRGKNSRSDSELETRYLKVRSSLKQRKMQLKELQKESASINEDLTNLRQAHSTLRSKNKRLEQISQSSKDEINQFRHSLNEAEIQLGNEEKRNQTIIDQLQEMIEKNATLTTENQLHQTNFDQLDQQYRHSVSQLEALECELELCRTLTQTQQTEIDQYQSTIATLEQRIETTDQALVDANDSLQKTQQDLVARCHDIDTLRTEKDELQEQIEDRTKTLTQLETQLASSHQTKAERDEFALDLATAASSLTEQRQALEQCESELEQTTANLAERDQQISTLKSLLTDEQENRSQLEQFNAACQTRLDELETQLSDKTTSYSESVLALNAARKANAESQKQISELEVELSQANNRENTLRWKVAELQQTVEQQQHQVSELCAIREENAIHALDLAETKAELASETSALAELREQAHHWQTVATELETARRTIQQYHERNSELESLFLQQAVQISELTQQAERIPKLEVALKQRQNDIEQARAEIEERDTTILMAERACDETEVELAETIAHIHALEVRILSMTEDNNSLSADNTRLATANHQAAEQQLQLRAQLDRASISEQLLDECNAELMAIKQEREQLFVARDELEATISRLGKQITNHLSEARQMNEQLSQAAIEHEKLEFALRAETEARDTTIVELKTQLAVRSEQHDAVVDQLAAKTSKLDQRQIEITELSSQLELSKIAHDQNVQLTSQVGDLEKQLHSKSEEHKGLIGDISLKSSQIADQIQEIERLSRDLKSAKSDREERDIMKAEVAELKVHLGCIREELEDSLDTNAKGQDRIRDLENQLHDHVAKIRDLRRERNASSAIQLTDEFRKGDNDSEQKAA